MNGQEGILCFLDNCASITKLKSLSEAGKIELLSSTSTLDEEWVDANRGLLAAAAHGLYHRLHPGGQLHDDEIVTNVAAWSFRVLDPIIVERRDDEELSLVEEGLHKSFLDQQEKKEESRRPILEDETRPCSERRGVLLPREGNGLFNGRNPVFFLQECQWFCRIQQALTLMRFGFFQPSNVFHRGFHFGKCHN